MTYSEEEKERKEGEWREISGENGRMGGSEGGNGLTRCLRH